MNQFVFHLPLRMCCFVVLLSLLFSCQHRSDAYKALEMERDSLLLEEQKKLAEMNQMLAVFNLIEENFSQIKTAENYVQFQTEQEQITEDGVERIVQDITLIQQILTENRKQVRALQDQVSNTKSSSRELKRMVDRMQQELNDHEVLFTQMREQLIMKDIQIEVLGEVVQHLEDSVSGLSNQLETQQQQLRIQQEELNRVWFVFGTRKELRAHSIYTRNGLLEEGFDKDYFLEADAVSLDEIALYSKKVKLLTNHPASSYRLDTENGDVVLRILEPSTFWEVSRYLVVEVD